MIHTCRFCSLLLVTALLVLISTGVAASPPPQSQLVTFPNPGPDVLAELAGQGWDIWEVTPTHVTARLMPDQVTTLQAQGLEVTPLGVELQYKVDFPQCYRTFEAAVVRLQDWADTYPNLTELIDAGPSWRTTQGEADRRLWALRITNENNGGPKPKLLLVALHHAREIVTPEIALNLAELLLTDYGQDADVTWIVDNREIWVMPFANPDGHIYAAYRVDWRKNVDDSQSTCPASSPPNSFGIDLNRNYDHKWGTIGASSDPCHLTYRGPAAFSEPETQAIRDLVQDQQFNLVISLHSFGDLILYPWGYTLSRAPNAADLLDVAAVLASFNSYTPQQSSSLYPTSGDTCDWVYGTQGTPCFTFEIGSGFTENYFWPDCETAYGQWLENRDALLHAIKLAGNPYQMARAPVARNIVLHHRGRQMTVRAVLDRRATSPEPPAGGEVFVGDVGALGSGILLTPEDQVLDAPVETMTATVDLFGLQGRYPLYVVGTDDAGRPGPPTAVYFEPCPDVTDDAEIRVDDVMGIAALWHTRAGDLEFDPALDLNGDDRIDVQDITEMAKHWDMSCGR